MTNSQRLAAVRDHLRRWLGEEVDSADRDSAPEISCESILIRDGFYAGRTFLASNGSDSFSATWFMEPDELKIRDPQGNVLAVFQGDEIVATSIAMDDSADQETISIPMSPAAQTTPQRTDSHDQGDGQIHKAA